MKFPTLDSDGSGLVPRSPTEYSFRVGDNAEASTQVRGSGHGDPLT